MNRRSFLKSCGGVLDLECIKPVEFPSSWLETIESWEKLETEIQKALCVPLELLTGEIRV